MSSTMFWSSTTLAYDAFVPSIYQFMVIQCTEPSLGTVSDDVTFFRQIITTKFRSVAMFLIFGMQA
jgi:hypothetical protein